MGTAAARELAGGGRNTLLLERFTLGHSRGSSGGPTRIFRFTYEHPDSRCGSMRSAQAASGRDAT
jgi:sarcosine oxidase